MNPLTSRSKRRLCRSSIACFLEDANQRLQPRLRRWYSRGEVFRAVLPIRRTVTPGPFMRLLPEPVREDSADLTDQAEIPCRKGFSAEGRGRIRARRSSCPLAFYDVSCYDMVALAIYIVLRYTATPCGEIRAIPLSARSRLR